MSKFLQREAISLKINQSFNSSLTQQSLLPYSWYQQQIMFQLRIEISLLANSPSKINDYEISKSSNPKNLSQDSIALFRSSH